MSGNKHTISASAIEPSDNRQPDSVPELAHWAQDSTKGDSQLVREYREAFLLIDKVRGQMNGLALDSNLIETQVDGQAEERQTSIRPVEPLLIEERGLAAPADPPLAGPVPPAMTFTELARRFSEQMEQVVVTGRQISAASQQMASGVKELNDGIGMLKQKLSRVKY